LPRLICRITTRGSLVLVLRGAKIRWPFRIAALGHVGQKDYFDISANDSLPTEFQFKTSKMDRSAAIARFFSGDDLSADDYRKLKKNSPVILEATISGDLIHHFIVLDNCTIVEVQ
jgi:hypothetical protein